jgi:surface antigen
MGFFSAKSIAKQPVGARRLAACLLFAGTMALSGCMRSGIDDAFTLDTMTTGAIPARPAAPQVDTDEAAVARAVAEVDLSRSPTGPFAWANSVTGSTGVISTLSETDHGAGTCRDFTTSMHRYDGIALFSGTSCRDAEGGWNLQAFEAVR